MLETVSRDSEAEALERNNLNTERRSAVENTENRATVMISLVRLIRPSCHAEPDRFLFIGVEKRWVRASLREGELGEPARSWQIVVAAHPEQSRPKLDIRGGHCRNKHFHLLQSFPSQPCACLCYSLHRGTRNQRYNYSRKVGNLRWKDKRVSLPDICLCESGARTSLTAHPGYRGPLRQQHLSNEGAQRRG